MAHRINWDDLQYVMAVAENGSLSAAARSLGVNHATVLRRISAFEEANQVQLFDRHPSGYRLTPQSRYVLDTLQSIKEQVGGLERSISGLGSPFEGNIRVTSTDTLCQEFLIPKIARLNKLHPNLNIQLLSTNYRLDLASMDAEITIRPTLALGEELVGQKVAKMRFEPFATRTYWLENPSSDIDDHQWIGVAEPLSKSPAGTWQEENQLSNIVLNSDSFLMMQKFAEHDAGVALLPSFIGNKSAQLLPSNKFGIDLVTDIWAATHKDLAKSQWISELINHFVDVFADNQGFFMGNR